MNTMRSIAIGAAQSVPHVTFVSSGTDTITISIPNDPHAVGDPSRFSNWFMEEVQKSIPSGYTAAGWKVEVIVR